MFLNYGWSFDQQLEISSNYVLGTLLQDIVHYMRTNAACSRAVRGAILQVIIYRRVLHEWLMHIWKGKKDVGVELLLDWPEQLKNPALKFWVHLLRILVVKFYLASHNCKVKGLRFSYATRVCNFVIWKWNLYHIQTILLLSRRKF